MSIEETIIFILISLLITSLLIILKLKVDIKFLKATLGYENILNNLDKEIINSEC